MAVRGPVHTVEGDLRRSLDRGHLQPGFSHRAHGLHVPVLRPGPGRGLCRGTGVSDRYLLRRASRAFRLYLSDRFLCHICGFPVFQPSDPQGTGNHNRSGNGPEGPPVPGGAVCFFQHLDHNGHLPDRFGGLHSGYRPDHPPVFRPVQPVEAGSRKRGRRAFHRRGIGGGIKDEEILNQALEDAKIILQEKDKLSTRLKNITLKTIESYNLD